MKHSDRTERKEVQAPPSAATTLPTILENSTTMTKYQTETKTTFVAVAADGTKTKDEKPTVLATCDYDGPGSDKATEAENDKEFATWIAANANTVVTGTVNARDGQAEKKIAATTINNFEAWRYGVSLLANQIGRKEADLAKAVVDHKITIGRSVTDLDTLSDVDLVNALNKITDAMVMVDFGATNIAKINDKIEKTLEVGKMHKDAKGAFVVGPVKGNGAKK